MGKHVNYFDISDFQGVVRGSIHDREKARCDPELGPHPPRRRSDPPTQHPLVADNLQQLQLAISSLTHSIVQHNNFVALSRSEVHTNDIDKGVGASTCIGEYSEERAHRHRIHPCEPHICSNCR